MGRTRSSGDAVLRKGLNLDTEAETVSKSNSSEAGTIFVGKIDEGWIWQILIKHI